MARPADRRRGRSLGGRSYEILIGPGLLAQAGPRIAAPGAGPPSLPTTTSPPSPALAASLKTAGLRHGRIVTPGEGSKSASPAGALCEDLMGESSAATSSSRSAAAWSAISPALRRRSTARHRFVQMPTTLLAQVDSSVGGKTGIDTRHGKNLIGAFHQPRLVLADTDVLDTLPPREFRAGYAEVAKYGLLDDAALLRLVEAHWRRCWPAGRSATTPSPRLPGEGGDRRRDERENGDRALLNLGHTFGHALEA